MYKMKKVSGTATGIPTGLALGILSSMAVTLLGAALTALLIAGEKIGEANTGYAAMVILILASATGAFVSTCLIKRLRLQICMLSGVAYYLMLLAMTALLFGGQYQGMGVSGIAILVGCVVIAFLPDKDRQPGKKRKHAYR